MISFYFILFFYFAGLGANLSSLSPYLLENFEENAEWIFISIQLMVPVGTLFAGWLSDKTKKIRLFLYYSLVLTIPAQYFLFSFSDDWKITMLFAGILRFLLSANYQWVVIAALEKMGEHNFSKIRSSGTLGFLLVQFLLFILTYPTLNLLKSPLLTGKLGSIFYIIPLFFLHNLPRERISEQEFKFKDALVHISSKIQIIFFALSFFFYASYQIIDNYNGRYFQLSFGLETVYLSWVFAVLLEIPFLLSVTRIIHKFEFFSLFYLSLIAGIIRFLFLSYSVTGTSLLLLLLFQLPHAILFAGYYMGSIHFFRKTVPVHIYGSVYGLYSIFAMSLGGMCGNLISGSLLHSDMGVKLSLFLKMSNVNEKAISFLPLFLMALLIYAIILPFFIVLSKLYKLSQKNNFK